MKKILSLLFMFSMLVFNIQTAKALTYKQAMETSKPIAILVYADWADNIDKIKQSFNEMQNKYGDKYNFVMLNIASEDTKLFNQSYHIYPNLPYVLLFKDKGKVSRYLQRSCVEDSACFSERLNFFVN